MSLCSLLTLREAIQRHRVRARRSNCNHRHSAAWRLSHHWDDISSIPGKRGNGPMSAEEPCFIALHYMSKGRVGVLSKDLKEPSGVDNLLLFLQYR